MQSTPQELSLRLVPEGEEDARSDDLATARERLDAANERIEEIERELESIVDDEAEIARQLTARRTRMAVLHEELYHARDEATRLAAEEADRVRGEMLAEAEAVLDSARSEANAAAEHILAEATAQAEQTVADGQSRLDALEADALQRAADLDAEHRELSARLQAMQSMYQGLQATLKNVAESSIKELDETQTNLASIEQDPTPQPELDPEPEPDIGLRTSLDQPIPVVES